jgi:hypothetical protein
VKLLSAALQKQNYNLAAYVLVYGLLKASVEKPKNPPCVHPVKVREARGIMNTDFQAPHNSYGIKRKKQEKG